MTEEARFRAARRIAGVLFAVAAVNHAVLAARGEGVVWRHDLFVGINLVLGALVALPKSAPRWALPPIALLSLQQIPSHGSDFVRSFSSPAGGAVDWPSLGVVLFFPAVIALLVAERRRSGRPARPTGAPRGS